MIKKLNETLCIFFATLFTNLALFVLLAFMARLLMLFWLKDEDLSVDVSSILPVFIMGLRFDLKIGVIFACLVALPLLFLTASHRLLKLWQYVLWGIVLLVLVANYGYFSFYGAPFNALVFGLFDDDTLAIVQTLITDFPVVKMTLFIMIAAVLVMKINQMASAQLQHVFFKCFLGQRYSALGYITLLLVLGMMAKGTLAGVALQRQHMVVTNNQFLNNLVPNAISALYYAISAKKNEPSMTDSEFMVRQLGFDSIFEVGHTLGVTADSKEALVNAFYVNTGHQALEHNSLLNETHFNQGTQIRDVTNAIKADEPLFSNEAAPKDLVFFLMESMGQEPFLYQSEQFDVLGKLNDAKATACHFDNFDSIQNGTFPSLEGILYHSPVTPLTQGIYAYHTMPWSVAMSLKNAGYHTVFFTGGRSSWRNLDQSLPHQGFDEILDAGFILDNYPNSYMDMWGVPDEFLFQAISDYRKKYKTLQAKSSTPKPLFIFVLTITNHPPYTLPDWQQNAALDVTYWQGDKSDPLLENNLNTFRYSANALGEFVLNASEEIASNRLVISATGDHNARTFGRYSSPQRVHLANQVPFLVWANKASCGDQLHMPASHRDMFPTLFELLNSDIRYFKSGRNLFEQGLDSKDAMALQFAGSARNHHHTWQIQGNAPSQSDAQLCEKESVQCDALTKQWRVARAALAFADWHIRYQLSKNQ